MNVRIPQDVDLEDKLVFGLSPTRFGYLVIAALASLSLWRLEPLPPELRAAACALVLATGASMAWGRWRGRSLDSWLLDATVFVGRNYRVQVVVPPLLARARRGVRAVEVRTVSLAAINALALPDPVPAIPLPPASEPTA